MYLLRKNCIHSLKVRSITILWSQVSIIASSQANERFLTLTPVGIQGGSCERLQVHSDPSKMKASGEMEGTGKTELSADTTHYCCLVKSEVLSLKCRAVSLKLDLSTFLQTCYTGFQSHSCSPKHHFSLALSAFGKILTAKDKIAFITEKCMINN